MIDGVVVGVKAGGGMTMEVKQRAWTARRCLAPTPSSSSTSVDIDHPLLGDRLWLIYQRD